MTTRPDAQRQPRLNRLHQLIESDVFSRSRPDDGACELAFVDVIRLLNSLLQQSEEAGHRVDFIKEVGVHGKLQDITSLISSIDHSLIRETDIPPHFAANQFNCYYDAGSGYFANGVFFSADYDDEVAFFVGDQRVYLNRHIKRALQEAEQYLTTRAIPVAKA